MEKMQDFVLADADRLMLRQLEDFLPDKVFDVHAHIHDCAFMLNDGHPGTLVYQAGQVVGADQFMEVQGALYGKAKVRANLIVFPDKGMADLENGTRAASTRFLAKELESHAEHVGEIVVLPTDTLESIDAQLVHPRIKGLKCYHYLAQKEGNTFQCDIAEYLPEAAWQAAEKHRLCITLHMVKDEALADPNNLRYIQTMAKKYPAAVLILAHCARSFAAWTAVENIAALRDFPNVYVDIAAVCESPAIMACMKGLGCRRVLWGSDYPVSALRGKCVSMGKTFLWLYKEQLAACNSNTDFQAALIAVEALAAFQQACKLLDTPRADVEAMFYDNAMGIFGLKD